MTIWIPVNDDGGRHISRADKDGCAEFFFSPWSFVPNKLHNCFDRTGLPAGVQYASGFSWWHLALPGWGDHLHCCLC